MVKAMLVELTVVVTTARVVVVAKDLPVQMVAPQTILVVMEDLEAVD